MTRPKREWVTVARSFNSVPRMIERRPSAIRMHLLSDQTVFPENNFSARSTNFRFEYSRLPLGQRHSSRTGDVLRDEFRPTVHPAPVCEDVRRSRVRRSPHPLRSGRLRRRKSRARRRSAYISRAARLSGLLEGAQRAAIKAGREERIDIESWEDASTPVSTHPRAHHLLLVPRHEAIPERKAPPRRRFRGRYDAAVESRFPRCIPHRRSQCSLVERDRSRSGAALCSARMARCN